MRPEIKSTGLGRIFCRNGPSKHRRLRHGKEITHQMQRPGTGHTIFLQTLKVADRGKTKYRIVIILIPYKHMCQKGRSLRVERRTKRVVGRA